MANFPAKDMVLQILDSASPGQYLSVGALTNVSLQIANSEEDISSKGDNQARKLYSAGAQKSYTISGDFVLTDANGFTDLRAAAESADPKIMAKLDDGQSIYSGEWHIAQFSVQGGAFGAVTGQISLSSSGTIGVAAS